MNKTKTRRIVILGKTGSGKSSLANTIFGENIFKIGKTVKSETSKCRAVTRSVRGRSITLIDTPGFFDTDRPEEELKPEIVRCITESSPGPHAFLIVLKAERFTEHEQAVIKKIEQYFTEELLKYATFVFTHGDQLDEGQTIQEFLQDNEIMTDLMKKCGGRCHVIDNKYWKGDQQDEYRSNNFQVEQLLKTIDKMTEANKGGCYTNEMLQAVEEEIKQEEERIRQSSRNMSEEEVRKQAKSNVVQWLLIKLAGVATGALLGAFCGVVVMVAAVVPLIKAAPALAKILPAVGQIGPEAIEGAARMSLNVTAVKYSAAAGAAVGGVAGYFAAEGAETPLEAAKKTADSVVGGTKIIINAVKNISKESNP